MSIYLSVYSIVIKMNDWMQLLVTTLDTKCVKDGHQSWILNQWMLPLPVLPIKHCFLQEKGSGEPKTLEAHRQQAGIFFQVFARLTLPLPFFFYSSLLCEPLSKSAHLRRWQLRHLDFKIQLGINSSDCTHFFKDPALSLFTPLVVAKQLNNWWCVCLSFS